MNTYNAKKLVIILDKFTDTIKDILSPSIERSEIVSFLSDFKYKFKKRKEDAEDKGKDIEEENENDRDFIDNLIIDVNTDDVYLQINND